MEHVGIDVHKTQSQICILTEDGAVIERRIVTDRQRFAAVLGSRPGGASILLEASTESEWVACCLEELGHTVIVADPNYALMYATRSRRVKTDRRDARTLAEACRLGTYRPVHRTSPGRRYVRAELAARDALVRTRTRYIAVMTALLRREGVRVPSGSAAKFLTRVERLTIPAPLAAAITPLRAVMGALNRELRAVEARLAERVNADAVMRRLQTVPGVGPVTAATFVATLDDVTRFDHAAQVTAYLGLVPSERSSGERQRRGAITKTGDRRTRWVLTQAAWTVWRMRSAPTEPLRLWARRIAGRRGTHVAVVALARRLARILYALWRDGAEYAPRPQRSAVAVTA